MERSGRLFRLQAIDGHTGWGDSAPLPDFGITASAADAFAEETAHLDLIAQGSGLPLHQWLSGSPPVDSLAVNGNLGALSEATPDQVKKFADLGYRVIKVKIGRLSVAREIAQLEALTRQSADSISWRLDANCAWSDADASAFIAACANLPIEGLEEPLTNPDHKMLARLQAMAPWPIAIDESTHLLDDEFFRHPPVRRLVIKPARQGGLLGSMELALRARASGVEVVVTSSLESACGLAACAQLAAALAPKVVHGLATAEWFSMDTGNGCRITNGRMQLPATPGLGFIPNDGYLGLRSR